MKSFKQFVNENINLDDANSIKDIMSSGNVDLGIQLLKGLGIKPKDFIKFLLNVNTDAELNLILELTKTAPTFSGIKQILNSNIEFLSKLNDIINLEEFNKMLELGYFLDSGSIQLKNGTLVFAKPGATKRLGIFPNGFVRRMFLRGDHGQDGKIKQFSETGVELYRVAINWILQNINHTNRELLTARVVASGEKAADTLTLLKSKIYEQYEKLGFSSRETEILIGGFDSTITRNREMLTEIRSYVKREITPCYSYFYSPRKKPMLYQVLAEPGVNWVKLMKPSVISIYKETKEIWNTFNLKEQLSLTEELFSKNWYFSAFTIKLEDASELEYYLQFFGIERNPKPQEVLDLEFLYEVGTLSRSEYLTELKKTGYREYKDINGIKISINVYDPEDYSNPENFLAS